MLHDFVQWVLEIFGQMGYIGIFIMMTIESSFVPFPSEVAMIPAGVLAHSGQMNFGIAFLVGTLGAWLGASINYVIGYFLGGPLLKKFIEKYGKFVFLKPSHYEQAEKYFAKNGGKTTLVGRFLPAVRQLISLPAGVFKMNFVKFSLFTLIGAGIWNIILLCIGYFFANQQDLILKNLNTFGIALLSVILVYIAYHIWTKKKMQK